MKIFGLKIQMHKHNYWEHRGFTAEEHKLIRKRKLRKNWRNSTELKCQSASPKTAPTNWAFLSQKLERRTEWGRWADPRMNTSNVWHCNWVMTWIQLSSSTTEVEEVPACTPWSRGRHFCKSYCWNITWNDVTTLITHLQRRSGKRKRFKASCKIHEETEEPVLREGCKSLICLT